MAYSELQQRLEHIVSYSSQLVFVSGEKLAQHRALLDDFLFSQGEDSEIAFFTAEPEQRPEHLRLQICQQLLGYEQQFAIKRPLNELLAGLNHHEGAVLISIFNAHLLPNAFLQELWNLVLQSRFARNKQHLNVLLFGHPEWAQQAKDWLPSKNADKPILLSNHRVQQNGESTLDKLLREKREQFAARLQAREQTQEPSLLLQNRWFKLAMATVFVLVFAAMLAWQYADSLLPSKSISNSNSLDAQQASAPPEPKAVSSATEQPPSLSTTASVVEETQPTDAKQATVTNWQRQVDKINARSKTSQENTPQPANAEPATPVTSAPTAPASEQQVTQQQAANDYPVADILSVEQLASTEPSSPQAEANYDADTIRQLTSSGYLVQLMGMNDENLLADFLRDHQLQGKIWIYPDQRNNQRWLVVVLPQSFANLQQAKQAIEKLDTPFSKQQAFIKSVAAAQRALPPL